MSLRARLILIVVGLSVLGIGLAVGATFGAVQDFDGDVAELDPAAYEELTSRVAAVAIVSGVGAVVAMGLLSAIALRRGLRPLERIAETAGRIGAGELSHRMPQEAPGTEVGVVSDALNRMLAELEKAFAERTAAEQRLRRFVADASHELRTPVATIGGYAELYRRGGAEHPEDLAKILARIESEAWRMGVLVDELLLLARLDEGRPLERAPVDLAEVAADAVAAAQARDDRRTWSLHADPQAVVTGDAARLRQVIDNLLTNVERHADPGPASVLVRCDGDDVVVEVQDSGPGMPPEQAGRVLERFYRVDPSRSRATGGHGLGLSIVDAVVRAHAGAVVVRSEPGTGTTVRIRLPRRGRF
ncbi:HAMP domain-containing sensor histidine kinase [Thermocrispum sp.]|uniref:histidine kinase n=2 Tax=Thermocrispum agreste TaxID=37925 RepID=A0ABD6FD16_9PSEU|nr:HAMP domain-containing sensor histidine kinase [Thermocrispum sp.]